MLIPIDSLFGPNPPDCLLTQVTGRLTIFFRKTRDDAARRETAERDVRVRLAKELRDANAAAEALVAEAGARRAASQWGQGAGARLSIQELPDGGAHGVYLIHRMPDISTLRDAPSPGQFRGPIGPRGRSLQRRQKSGALLSLYVVSTIERTECK